MTGPKRRSPRARAASSRDRSGACQLYTTALERMASFSSRVRRRYSSGGICFSHWKGVKGLGTK